MKIADSAFNMFSFLGARRCASPSIPVPRCSPPGKESKRTASACAERSTGSRDTLLYRTACSLSNGAGERRVREASKFERDGYTHPYGNLSSFIISSRALDHFTFLRGALNTDDL